MRRFLLLLFAAIAFLTAAIARADDGDNSSDDAAGMHMMSAFYGNYRHTREASGTAWQPDSTPMEGWHFNYDDWALMAHGFAFGIYNNQGGKRGADKGYSTNMFMLMGSRRIGDGTIGFRSMLSLEPLMGKQGYPELLQTGETANGVDPLIDRQHPHDLFMELAATYSYDLTENGSLFLYGGLPGEPAVGPPAFMHRWSGENIPDAPITHHWLDSTHVTFGVLTAGYIYDNVKLEGSLFNGREPDQHRYNIETRALDSYSFRATYNPTEDWSAQVSYAYLDSPEQLSPQVSQERFTASATYNHSFDENNWAATIAWGKDVNEPGNNLDALLIEATVNFYDTHTIFGRFEDVQKDEFFETGLYAGRVFLVNKLALGYIYDFPVLYNHLQFGVGGEAELALIPGSLEDSYGDAPFSYLLFVRGKIV